MPAKKRTRPGSNGLPAANTHALRELAGTPADPDVVLASLPIGTPDYLRVIGAYLRKYNHQHAWKHKGVGFRTMLDRQRLYASFFTELRQLTAYRNLDPRQLANRHVEVVVRRWLERGLKTTVSVTLNSMKGGTKSAPATRSTPGAPLRAGSRTGRSGPPQPSQCSMLMPVSPRQDSTVTLAHRSTTSSFCLLSV